MTFLELPDTETFDLALELFYSGDCPTLDEAAALAFDMQAVVADCAAEWDLDSLEWQMAVAFAQQVQP